MKTRLAEHRITFLLLTILLLIQSFSIDLDNPYRKPIAGDAQAYYAYLPAIFIYQDLDYRFVPEIQKKYYVPASSKSFLKEVDGEKVNKTFPGVTLLYLPFFLLAHAVSLLFGLPADGYAETYQLFYLIGFWFYFLMGMIFFRKVLIELKFSSAITNLSLASLVLGTNMFFYTVYDQSVTHIYSFFLINWSVYLFLKLRASFDLKKLALLVSLLALIGITRPTNILVLGVLLFFVPERSFYNSLWTRLIRIKNIFKILLPAFLILSIPFILWKLQTGNWVVYSYGEEGFNFSQPEIFQFLFSYTKGWFLYTPLMLFILIFGFLLLFKKNRQQFYIGVTFFILAIYVYSSWWCWYYGAGMSQRVMIDFYLIPGFLLALLLARAQSSRTSLPNANRKRIAPAYFLLPVLFIFTVFNLAQAYQVSKGILPFGSPTKAQYWDNFLVFKKRARVYPQDHWAFVSKGTVSLDPKQGQIIKGNSVEIDGTWCLKTSESDDYSAVAQIPNQAFKKGNKVILTFEAKANSPVEQTRLVLLFDDLPDHVFYLKEYISEDWERMQYMVEIPITTSTPIDLYLWNAGSGEQVDLRNLTWEVYFSEGYF